MKYILLTILFATACNTELQPNALQEALSSASFGTETHRIQFNENAILLKYSPRASGFDDVSGATYALNNTIGGLVYFDLATTTDVLAVVMSVDNQVNTSLNGTNTQEFTPKASNLGADPPSSSTTGS